MNTETPIKIAKLPPPKYTVEFRDSTHRYFRSGAEMMGVTRTFTLTGIVDFSKVRAEVIEPSLVLGDYVHEMAKLYGLGRLDETTVDPPLMGYLAAIKKFYAENVKEILLIEQPVCDPYNLYAGTPDLVYINFKDKTVLDDWKTPAKPHPAWGLQTGAYKPAVEKCYPDVKIQLRGGVLLRENGTYERHAHKSATDLDYFLAALKVARFKEQHRIRT